MATLTKMAMMNMEEILYLEGVTALTRALEKYLQETPVWSESRLNRISELATNLGSAKLVKIAENILTRYKEILDMLQKRQETLHRAEERLSVSRACLIFLFMFLRPQNECNSRFEIRRLVIFFVLHYEMITSCIMFVFL